MVEFDLNQLSIDQFWLKYDQNWHFTLPKRFLVENFAILIKLNSFFIIFSLLVDKKWSVGGNSVDK
jgi:hypothetical protein